MTGVEILATGKHATDFEPNFPTLLFVLALCAIGGTIIGSKDKEYGLGAMIGLAIGLFAGFFLSVIVGIVEIEYYPIYKVIISNEVSMNEFMDRYEILNQDGKIYTVKERTPDVD